MKIVGKDEAGKGFTLWLPTRLALNRAVGKIVANAATHKGVPLSYDQVCALMDAVRCCGRMYPDVPLIEVSSANGEYVKIQL